MTQVSSLIPKKQKLPSHELFRIGKMKPVIKPTRPHGHDAYFELILLTEGSGKHIIELEEYQIHPGMAFWLKPGQIHCWDFSRIPSGYVLMFRKEFLDQHPVIQHRGIHWLGEFPVAIRLTPQYLNWMDRIIQTLQELPNNVYNQQAGYVILLLQHLETAAKTRVNESPNPQQVLLSQFRHMVDQQYLKRWAIPEYAHSLNISERKLNQICKEQTGATAKELVNERVLLEAKRLLIHTSLTVSEIAYELDFHDPSHFVKFFKKQANLTPGEFQQRLERAI